MCSNRLLGLCMQDFCYFSRFVYLFISFPAYFLVNFYGHIIYFYQSTIDKISMATYKQEERKKKTKIGSSFSLSSQ